MKYRNNNNSNYYYYEDERPQWNGATQRRYSYYPRPRYYNAPRNPRMRISMQSKGIRKHLRVTPHFAQPYGKGPAQQQRQF